MWRWIIRIDVSFVVFGLLLFLSGALLIRTAHFLARVGFPVFSHWIHSHVLLIMFLLGVTVGQVVLGSNFTGRGWFRSKSGLTYEGFKLEELKSWSWVIVSPVLLMGIVFWFVMQKEGGASFAQMGWQSFYRGFLMPECSNRKILGIGGDSACSIQLMFSAHGSLPLDILWLQPLENLFRISSAFLSHRLAVRSGLG